MRRLSLFLAGACLCGPAFASNCSMTSFNALPGTDTSAQMVVHSGATCAIQMTVRGGGMQMSVGKPAMNGTVTIPGPTSFAYASRPGFTGTDAFEADFTGELLANGKGHDMRGTAHIAVNVTVVR